MLTTNHVAERLGVNPSRVRQLAAEFSIGTKIGRDWMFTEDDVTALADRKTKPGPARLSESLAESAHGFDDIGMPRVASQLRRLSATHAAARIANCDLDSDPAQTI